MTKEGEIISAVEKVIEERGTIDILVNNAGIQYISPVEDFPEEKWDSVIDVILKELFNDKTCCSDHETTKKDELLTFLLPTAEFPMLINQLILLRNLDKSVLQKQLH